VSRTGAYAPRMSLLDGILRSFAETTSYPEEVKSLFRDGSITLESDLIRFAPAAVNSYTVALVASFLQSMHILQNSSFSQESVFSHVSKVDALRDARKNGFRTYLYFVATESAVINAARVENRATLGGHAVPPEKIASRYPLSVANAADALRFLSRAYFFDNSGEMMRFFAEWDEETGLMSSDESKDGFPKWFAPIADAAKNISVPGGRFDVQPNPALSAPAARASHDAIARAFAAGLPVTVMRGGRIVRVSPDGTETEVKGGLS
ncbi:MAG: hypothetical protein II391_05025, partial [Kiritimatiellae bacterium]|nr:hypothetical protein [Kiritimatiellia bacterium]